MLKKIGKRLKDQRGLTLVELLAVVVILGIIAAIAVPSIGNVIAKSKYEAAKADALQIISAATMADASGIDITTEAVGLDKIKEYIDITDDNISSGWTVQKVAGEVKLISAVSEHPAKDSQNPSFSGTRAEINKMTYEDSNSDGK